MRTLMLSLDQEILNPDSRVAARMRSYGQNKTIDIIIPSVKNNTVNLSPTVTAYGSGGTKWQQFFYLLKRGSGLLQLNNYEIITAQDPFLVGFAGMLLKQKKQIFEIQIHGDFFGGSYYRNSGLKNWLYYYLARWLVIPYADQIRVVGERVKQSIIKLGIREEKISVQPIVVPVKEIQEYIPKQNAHDLFPEFNKIFLCLGRLDTVKNVGWLIAVFNDYVHNNHVPVLLLIAGDGSERNQLEIQVKNLDAKNYIRFLGALKNPLDYLKTVDCLLFPSLSEGYGLVAMEAAAAGTKIIMNDVGVANYELKASERVTIVAVNDWVEFMTALKNI
ncbi:MAG: hypothetical protein A2821_02920 [Candidatus Magasanikbacteria bacterium RIFCSPHIGHO2_01_FULL_41_23]|uniref:Glycosyl transferase family 1 domain-containing protein n=1 Tax=Candidatus Magasanikbacteria bacterium RIFCSPLOWO2_01_FULL_40_15 TaxID=1798686 RepID=A0A1F6N3K7_9BACT|nr:MAG: hypothetical protein A2821_02920 [Candidatus Magasanikbacteria bacterium RIFCSPHIGHO2_01_FULL_41_23]OGH67290.1 MAG: hypothetical protein A3C66_00935 [Candidatus Magasanikbacteria bacterium RIFCSPHIGHO2_02_FULL_41_35]OGH76515.1 MAG: hypothetical protein A3F22_00145 [Candidatus Magasanikbacteria bacterium RIFCSPHIGHO2_12_FULL_41_16]OGH78499.1 MAG: hypothetical protein A2983_03210 [Candidatus Magasanikbacteria bacterium RIFCSPLOWO2_01_FULL_40_15]